MRLRAWFPDKPRRHREQLSTAAAGPGRAFGGSGLPGEQPLYVGGPILGVAAVAVLECEFDVDQSVCVGCCSDWL